MASKYFIQCFQCHKACVVETKTLVPKIVGKRIAVFCPKNKGVVSINLSAFKNIEDSNSYEHKFFLTN